MIYFIEIFYNLEIKVTRLIENWKLISRSLPITIHGFTKLVTTHNKNITKNQLCFLQHNYFAFYLESSKQRFFKYKISINFLLNWQSNVTISKCLLTIKKFKSIYNVKCKLQNNGIFCIWFTFFHCICISNCNEIYIGLNSNVKYM